MTLLIIGAVIAGMAAGHWLFPEWIAMYCSDFITVGLCLILLLVGVDMGRQGNVWRDIKAAGLKTLIFPAAVMAGTLGAAAVASLFLPMSVKDTVAASAGFGWYSLAPILLADYSASVSAVAFLSNVMREVLSIILIPIVSAKIGYIECVSLPGAAAMDTVLPVVVKSTDDHIAIYSFVSGVILSFAVPVIIPAIIGIG
ncbi:MAG: lysine exporter LysO family protein [Clostridiales bacterium]|nr:lysine exporter LysO family protein [Clostridiales bacterium]MDY3745793.1 lysine exporter LysO family protein [Lachnospiraceae bacterium]